MSKDDGKHLYEFSSARENVLEHLFIGEMLRSLWCKGFRQVEVLRSEYDSSGYDIVVDCQGIIRHIQLKSSYVQAKTADQKINIVLGQKPSGCVIWILFDRETLKITEFLCFGGRPGQQLPTLGDRVAKHTKGNAEGIKLERPNIRVLRRNQFQSVTNFDDLTQMLFGFARSETLGNAA